MKQFHFDYNWQSVEANDQETNKSMLIIQIILQVIICWRLGAYQ